MGQEAKLDLSPGDFLYQSDSELFLVTIRENEDSYFFAAHGWREIDKERAREYVEKEHGKLYTEEEIDEVMKESDNEEAVENYQLLCEMFDLYEEQFAEEGPHTDFALDDT